MLDSDQINILQQQLLQRQAELQGLLLQRQNSSQPVTLDQQAVGRVSRIDAIQQQQMAAANKAQAEVELKQIILALNLIESEDYGFCAECDEDIPFERLQVKPTSVYCVKCQQAQE